MPRIGLVLGAGGLAGQAFQGGVLSALAEELGWDPRDADLIVGTSAGSFTGALLRLGVPAADLAAWAAQEALSEESMRLVEQAGAFPEPPTLQFRSLVGLPRLPPLPLLASLARSPMRARLETLAVSVAPKGRVSFEELAAPLRSLAGDAWPTKPLWICAARAADLRREVFGRLGAPLTDVATAVSASCAIPGYFRPVRIAGRHYVDGGAYSPTSATLLADADVDLAVVVSPMSGVGSVRPELDLAVRRLFHVRLQQECARLERAGVPVVTFEPTARVRRAMGLNAMSPDCMAETVHEARRLARGRLDRPELRSRLAPLAATSRRPSRALTA